MTPAYENAIVLAVGLVLAVALAATGVLRVAKIGSALKERVQEYKALPIMVYVDRAQRQIGKATRRVETAPALVYRANAALRDIVNAGEKIARIATSPSKIWRLGELFLTGK